MPSNAKTDGAHCGTRGITPHIASRFEVIEYRRGGRIEVCNGRGMGKIVAVHSARIVVGNDHAGRASSVVNLRRRHHESVPRQSVCRPAYRPRELEYFRIQHDTGILCIRRRRLWRSDVSPAWKAAYGQFNIGRSYLHVFTLPAVEQDSDGSRFQRTILIP